VRAAPRPEPVGLLRELLDRVAAVAQNPGVPVDIGDRRGARCGVREARERDVPGLAQQLANIEPGRALGGGVSPVAAATPFILKRDAGRGRAGTVARAPHLLADRHRGLLLAGPGTHERPPM
jgi:hypothetical protein